MVFTAEVNAAVDHRHRTINLKAGFVFPNQRTVVNVDAVDVMIETAGNQTIAGDRRRGFQTVFGFEAPDQTAVARIETVKTAIGRTKINVLFIDRRLPGPTRA